MYSEILPHNVSLDKLDKIEPKCIIPSRGPSSVCEMESSQLSEKFFRFVRKRKIPDELNLNYPRHDYISLKYS